MPARTLSGNARNCSCVASRCGALQDAHSIACSAPDLLGPYSSNIHSHSMDILQAQALSESSRNLESFGKPDTCGVSGGWHICNRHLAGPVQYACASTLCNMHAAFSGELLDAGCREFKMSALVQLAQPPIALRASKAGILLVKSIHDAEQGVLFAEDALSVWLSSGADEPNRIQCPGRDWSACCLSPRGNALYAAAGPSVQIIQLHAPGNDQALHNTSMAMARSRRLQHSGGSCITDTHIQDTGGKSNQLRVSHIGTLEAVGQDAVIALQVSLDGSRLLGVTQSSSAFCWDLVSNTDNGTECVAVRPRLALMSQ